MPKRRRALEDISRPAGGLARLAAAALSFLFAPDLAFSQGQEPRISGANTLRLEYYQNRGDEAISPYQNEKDQWYNELSLNFDHRPSLFETRRAQVFALYNQSDYRSNFNDLSVERWNVFAEKGDVALPYRLELGDFFSQLSPRTQSRTLKGGQIEFQPQTRLFGGDHSFLAFLGADRTPWRRFSADYDYSTGASWLISHTPLGDFNANYVFNSREVDLEGPDVRRDQHILGLAWEKVLRFRQQEITVESEYSKFMGAHDNLSATETGRDKDDSGYFAQVSGKTGTPLTYRLRLDRYGHDFRPYGGNVTPDRQSYEGHAAWTFASGLQARGRLQRYQDGFQTNNETDTDVLGFGASGPLLPQWVKDLTMNSDVFVREADNRANTADSRTVSATLDLSKSLAGGWAVRPGVFHQEVESRVPNGDTAKTSQVALALDRPFQLAGLQGSVSPGVTLRRLRGGPTDSDDVGPTLALAVTRDAHSLDASFSFLDQRRLERDATDFHTSNVAVNYGYRRGAHTLGAEFEYQGLDPTPGQHNDGYRVSVYWTFQFGFTLPRKPWLVAGPAVAAPVEATVQILSRLTPGARVDDLVTFLATLGIRGPAALPTARVYELRLLKEIDQRQRLALAHDPQAVLTKAGLIIDFTDVGSPDTVERTFQKVRAELVKVFGKPSFFHEEGDFGPGFVLDVNNNRLIRLYEWTTPSGVLRFGLPRRLDGQVRMELQHAKSFPGPRQTLWSLAEVR